jgi:hypothetical protein
MTLCLDLFNEGVIDLQDVSYFNPNYGNPLITQVVIQDGLPFLVE